MTTILRLPSVKARIGLSRSSIYAFVSRGDFPRPISLGVRAVGWNSEAVDAWIASRVEQSRAMTKTEPTSVAAHGPSDSPAAPAAESRPIARFGRRRLQMGRRMNAGRSQHEGT
jgi:prophage regulatory protein